MFALFSVSNVKVVKIFSKFVHVNNLNDTDPITLEIIL